MQNSRRDILKGTAALAAATVFPHQVLAEKSSGEGAFEAAYTDIQNKLTSHLSGLGYQTIAGESILTDDESFNGGLRYDETGQHSGPAQMVIQMCTRVEDIQKKQRRDVLPMFHMMACSRPESMDPAGTGFQILNALTGLIGLKPNHFAFIGASPMKSYEPMLKEAGFGKSVRLYYRDDAEAREIADGSGYFRFPGNPDAPLQPTIGMNYWIGDGAPDVLDSYPQSAGWTEIGEIIIGDDNTAFAVGLERLTLASTGMIPTWDQRLAELIRVVEEQSSDGALPSGHEVFSKS